MDLRSNKLETVNEEEWHIVGCDWWYTPYQSITWAYPPEDAMSAVAKPPHYHGALFRAPGTMFAVSPRNHHSDANEGELILNPELSGVQGAWDIILPYEASVGIPPVYAGEERSFRRRDISIEVREAELALTREQWDKAAEDLFIVLKSPTSYSFTSEGSSGGSSPSSSHGDLCHSLSTLSSLDYTDSDHSTNSISRPSTPKRKTTDAIFQVKETSPLKGTVSRRPLNASASSFVPSSAKVDVVYDPSSPPPAFVNFGFPSLEVPPAPAIKLRKDDQGFYVKEEAESPVLETTFLPPFLQRPSPRRKTAASKTRAIIDRFRSSQGVPSEIPGASQSHCPTPNPPLYDSSLFEERIAVSEDGRNRSGKSTPSSMDEDGEGWINVSEANLDLKARQTRNLFLAFTRRRSNSSSPAQAAQEGGDNTQEIEIPMASSPDSLTPPITYNNGWVEGIPASSSPKPEVKPTPNAPRRAGSRSRSTRRRRTSQAPPVLGPSAPASFVPSSSAPATVLSHPPFPHFPAQPPPPYVYATYPAMMAAPMAYTSYMQQLHMHMQQLQMRANGGNGAGVGAVRIRRPSMAAADQRFPFPNPLAQPSTTPTMPPFTNPPITSTAGCGSLW